MSETNSQGQSGVCEDAAVHNTVSGANEIEGFTVATERGRVLHYSLYQCRKCGCQWAYFFDVDANNLTRISVGEYQRGKLYR